MRYHNFVFLAIFYSLQNFECVSSLAVDVPLPSYTTNSIELKYNFLNNVYSECTDKGSVPCFKYKLFAFIDKILNKDEINLADGITVVRTANPAVTDGAPRTFNQDTDTKGQANVDILNRIEQFFNTRTIKFDLRGTDILNAVSRIGKTLDNFSEKMSDESDEDTQTARKKGGGGGGGKKGSKMLGPLLMMMKMKLMGLIPIALGVIALMAGKALLIGKIALLLSLIIALKKLLNSHQKTVTYEIVSHPHSSGGHDSYSSGSDYSSYGGGGGGSSHGSWGRSADAHNIVYKAYKPKSDTKSE